MKEITRIHLAKVAYDIEVDAKKNIQQYIAALEKYANDSELLADIEIRITELLAERGVAAGGVIARDDVAAVRERLGEPSEFAPEGESPAVEPELIDEPRRVYRDLDGALLGGVLSGFAQFFGVNALWVRLIFIVLLAPSFGTVTVVYFLLWWVIPPARTAAEKLRMSGKPVTLASIKQFGEQAQPTVNTVARATKAILRYGAGTLFLLMAAGALLVTGVTGFGTIFGMHGMPLFEYAQVLDSWWLMTAFCLFILSGLLFVMLCFLLANALFARKWSRRTGVTVAVVIITGLVSFGTGVALGYGGVQANVQKAQDAMQETTAELPEGFADVKKLVVTAHAVRSALGESELAVEYIVDTHRAPSYTLTAVAGVEPHISVEGGEARVAFKTTAAQNNLYGWAQPRLVIRGPVLESLEVRQGIARYSAEYPNGQQSLLVSTGGTTRATIDGQYEQVYSKGEGDVDVSGGSISNLTIDMGGGSVVAGVVRTLAVSQPDACPAWGSYDNRMRVQVRSISSGVLRYNGQERPMTVMPVSNGCGSVLIEDAEMLEDN